MTAQINDTVMYLDRGFALAGINGHGLFEPAQIGLDVVMLSTACWRGYYCTYTVADDALLLTRLAVGLNEQDRALANRGEGPIRFGKIPQRDLLPSESFNLQTNEFESDTFWSDWYFEAIKHPMAYTGGLLIAASFMDEMYVHMGFHPAYKYREVRELIFADGRLVSATDRSAQIAEFREMIAGRALAPKDPHNRKEIADWIDRAFSRNYKL